MKPIIFLGILATAVLVWPAQARSNHSIDDMQWLVGNWQGVGREGEQGEPGGDTYIHWTAIHECAVASTFTFHNPGDAHVHYAFSVFRQNGDKVIGKGIHHGRDFETFEEQPWQWESDQVEEGLVRFRCVADCRANSVTYRLLPDGSLEARWDAVDDSAPDWIERYRRGEPHSNGNPSWSPAGNRLTFSSDRSGNGDLYLLDLDSMTLALLIGGDALELHSSWSPDGQWVVFDSNRSGNMDLWRADADGRNIVQLTNTPDANELVPSWSPDGTRVLFNRVMDDGMDVWLMDANGGREVNLTLSPGDDIARGWSPDGMTIAFNSNRDGDHDIYLMSADGSEVRQLTDHPADERIALWAPDGRYIYFARSHSEAEGGRELVRLELESGAEEVFFDSPHEDFYPVWSADGKRMAVVVRYDGGSDLYELSPDGEIVQRLTQ